jgi:hypothetical protein
MIKQTPASGDVWAAIENEKRRDRRLRKISIAAWTVTFVIVLLFTVAIGLQVSQMVKLMGAALGEGPFGMMALVGAAMPLFIVLGLLSVLIATLSTVGIFLRLRTASLAEIQLRLAALEEMLTTRSDVGDK